MKVRAIQMGFYKDSRVRVGTIFELDDGVKFSPKWMEKVEDDSPVGPQPKKADYRKPKAMSQVKPKDVAPLDAEVKTQSDESII